MTQNIKNFKIYSLLFITFTILSCEQNFDEIKGEKPIIGIKIEEKCLIN